MDDPSSSNSDWVWLVALDGIAGGVLSGVIAGLVVWVTIRHERRLQQEAELRQAVIALRADALAKGASTPAEDAERAEVARWVLDLHTSLAAVESAAYRLAPEFSRQIEEGEAAVAELLLSQYDRLRAVDLAASIGGRAHHWLTDPREYAKKDFGSW